ncbi:MAG TPA: hypothetical protein VGO37_00485 [Steroidobacteraceae bacterium]|jgi:hypothetical protein|nr:hypothetical protein [Steroidobacteraceae bacterium]
MQPPKIAGLIALLAVAGCASMKATPPRPATAPGASASPPSRASAATLPEPSPQSGADPAVDIGPAQKSSEKTPAPAATSPPSEIAPAGSSAKAKSSGDTRPAKQTAAPAPAPRSPSIPTPTSVKPPAQTLNLADLEQRLRDTHAIGVFTKLSLKNQVDDLLGEFRALYQGPNKHPPAELRQRYDQLLLKVLSLLQNGDPQLAAAVASSREAIWSILADPEKFSKI